MAGSRDLLQLLANPTNRTILSVLSLEPQYPRRLAELVGLTEDEASRRLRSFEKLGLAEGSWAHVGKNVRLYRLATSKFTVSVDASGLSVTGLPGDRAVVLGPAAEMPPILERFVGREEELATIETQLAARRALCLLGIGGAGKTAVASAYAKHSGRPLLWHTVAPGESGSLLLGRLAANQRALDPGERGQRLVSLRDAEEESLLVNAFLESVNTLGSLVVLDRLELAGPGAAQMVADFARGLSNARLLLTARTFPSGLPRDLVASYRLPGLSRTDAERLLTTYGARPSPDAFNEIFDRTRGHPLSLVLVSQVAEDRREAGVERLMQESGIRDFLLDDVLPQLTESERDLLYVLSVFRTPFLAEDAEAVSDHKHARHTLLKLEARGLVARAGDTFLLHDLVRGFVADAAPQKRLLHGKAAKHLRTSGEPAKVLEALHHSLESGAIAEAGAILRDEALRRTYRFTDHGLTELYRAELERLIALEKVEATVRAAAELELGILDMFDGQDASARTHLEAAERLGARDRSLAIPLALARARALRLDGMSREASQAYAQVEAAASAANDPAHLLEALIDHAFLQEEIEDAKAFELYGRAIEAAQQTSDLRALSLAYAGASRIGLRQGEEKYMGWAQEALRLARMTGYLRGEVSVYMTLTTHAMMVGQAETGLEYSDRYLRIATQLGDPWLRTCALNDKAILLVAHRRYEEGFQYATEGLQLARTIRSVFFELGAHLSRAEALLGLGRVPEAVQELETALANKVEAWPLITARAWRSLAVAHRRLGHNKEATACDKEARRWEAKPSGTVGYDYLFQPGPSGVRVSTKPPAERAKDAKRVLAPRRGRTR